ncbi:MoaD/ThiS family protein [Sphaerotilus microaerophilus]|jgi:molybdopterin converting factor small subunit|uniref:MoaD/ThiS family protein n=1 Tax=Sphaerotilus microaerophilus TaxID=2914710 RepID=A0ABN6PDG8_9BURK|nr:MoaD/ThiS family protein [Sphaerotilus sp. FB-5]BDI03054.1 hypothetical protein CATMQ487_00240 [Sphaerotilus sp. FB-5]
MRVLIPSALRSYTGAMWVELDLPAAPPPSVGTVLDALETRFPGMRFRMVDERGQLRPHMRCFVAGRAVHDLRRVLAAGEELHIVQALSGG